MNKTTTMITAILAVAVIAALAVLIFPDQTVNAPNLAPGGLGEWNWPPIPLGGDRFILKRGATCEGVIDGLFSYTPVNIEPFYFLQYAEQIACQHLGPDNECKKLGEDCRNKMNSWYEGYKSTIGRDLFGNLRNCEKYCKIVVKEPTLRKILEGKQPSIFELLGGESGAVLCISLSAERYKESMEKLNAAKSLAAALCNDREQLCHDTVPYCPDEQQPVIPYG
jgi:hypothetical protein